MVQAVVAVAERMYGSAEVVPDAVGWLLDEEFAFGEPYGSTGEFLGDLVDAVAHPGTCTDTTVEAVPFLMELVCDDKVAPGSRLVLLGDLLRLAASGAAAEVSLADRIAALGCVWEESAAEYPTRRAIGGELPRLLSRWGDENPQQDADAEDEDGDASAGDESEPSEPSEETRAGQGGPSRSPSGQLMQAVEQILVGAGRPMKVKDITEALGRPTKGDEGRAPIETTRATCKRLVKNGRAVEKPVGTFATRRVTESQGGDT
ncbi:hypothetical protein [Streptomyces fradiae]|uniref:hypothetical protein n=1 Tax=Streptomyces fradiae TaxID=1906 RepID=UPI00364FA951